MYHIAFFNLNGFVILAEEKIFFSVRLLFCVPFLSPKVGLEKKCVWLVTVQEAT